MLPSTRPPEANDGTARFKRGATVGISSDTDGLLGTAKVARRLGVQAQTVHRWCREGRLTCLKPGKSWLVRESALDGFLRGGEQRRTLVDHLRAFILVPDHIIAVAENHALVKRLDAAFFQVGAASGALLVKFIGGETTPIPELRDEFRRNGFAVDRLEAEGRFCWSAAVDPSRERGSVLHRALQEAAARGDQVWASFNWARSVDLEAMLRQQRELETLAGAASLVVMSAAVEAAADWDATGLREALEVQRGIVRLSRRVVVLSRAAPLEE